jgi:hypothetical protein
VAPFGELSSGHVGVPRLARLKPSPKTGGEPFHESGTASGFSLRDFWSWSMSDLVSNAARGVLAEFIVAKALGLRTDCVRMAWDKCDLVGERGLNIEVKSAAYIQTWAQKAPSKITFSVQRRRGWDANTNVQDKEARRHADIYVFAFLAHEDKNTIDPLDLNQWRFWAVSTRFLEERKRSQYSITMATLLKLVGEPVSYGELPRCVQRAGELPS